MKVIIILIIIMGSCFVLHSIIRHIFAAIAGNTKLKNQLRQQELMTTISQSFTTTKDMPLLIKEALKMAGEFLGVNHVFLSAYIKEKEAIKCLYEWHDGKALAFTGKAEEWPLTGDMGILDKMNKSGYAAVNDFSELSHPGFSIVEHYNMGSFLNIPICISGNLWGILGFIIYKKPHQWELSEILLGKQITGIVSGAISRNLAYEELIAAKDQAEQASKSKGDFLSRMSHEMRTPMNAIIGMTSIGKNDDDIARKNYCFSRIEAASTQLLGVINDILDMSKIEADKLELSFSDFSPKSMIDRIVNIISIQIESKKQQFNLSIDPNVPKMITSDEQRLTQVITNLLSNAVKFTPDEGAVSLFVRMIEHENANVILQFEVKDTGIGITKDQQHKLFNPFEQADSTISRKFGGTGLGLAISKRIIEMMNGTIWVESAFGQGASFIFNIQAKVPDTDSAVIEAEDADSIRYADGCFRGKKILIAEDIEINREIVAELLDFTGIDVDFAENGEMAYQMFSADPPAYGMIFMDIHMPELNGYDATKKIRQHDDSRGKTIPIVAMTADVFHEDIEKCLSSGMDDHVGKPLDMEEFLSKIVSFYP